MMRLRMTGDTSSCKLEQLRKQPLQADGKESPSEESYCYWMYTLPRIGA